MEVAAGQDYVRIDGLVKRYGNHAAIDHVSFGVAEGHTLALLGPSGCGKTTMLRCIAGLETPDEGRITIGGQPVFDAARGIDLPAEARGLGIVFQSYAIWPHMTVAENVGFPLRVRRVGRAEQRDRVRRMLEIVGLGDRHDRPATQLSGGQQQRVALARALVHEPKLVLFDEALSNLDAQLREQVRLELAMLQDRLGFTAIYVTHDQAEAFGLAETLVVMNRGRVETQGSPRDVFASPATPFVARFLGLNVLEGRVRGVAEEGVEMILANGAIIHGHSASCPPPGTEALACVRKEHVEIGEAGRGLPATVKTLSFQGLTEELMLDADGVELRAVRPASDRRAGDRVGVTIRPEHCLVLVKN